MDWGNIVIIAGAAALTVYIVYILVNWSREQRKEKEGFFQQATSQTQPTSPPPTPPSADPPTPSPSSSSGTGTYGTRMYVVKLFDVLLKRPATPGELDKYVAYKNESVILSQIMNDYGLLPSVSAPPSSASSPPPAPAAPAVDATTDRTITASPPKERRSHGHSDEPSDSDSDSDDGDRKRGERKSGDVGNRPHEANAPPPASSPFRRIINTVSPLFGTERVCLSKRDMLIKLSDLSSQVNQLHHWVSMH